jgi:hypothetical protein
VFDFIEGWYNTERRHSSLGQIAPLEYERRHAARLEAVDLEIDFPGSTQRHDHASA